MTDRELMQMALDALEAALSNDQPYISRSEETAEALRARLAQPEQEPVAWCIVDENGRVHGLVKSKPAVMNAEKWQPLYTTPPQREWQGLTENEIKHLWYEACQTNLELTSQLIVHLAKNIEAKLREKNSA